MTAPAVRTTFSAFAAVGLLLLATVATAHAQPPPPPAPSDTNGSLDIGTGAIDTFGGWLPDGITLSPFDVDNPIVGLLDPALLTAIQDATRKAATEKVDIRINSGWRSRGFQQRLFDDGVRFYGSVDAARQFVASPETSKHVEGKAVDIAPVEADKWLIANGKQFGLCQIFANEIWHFELATDDQGRCPPLKPNATG
ncbi:M15 family metallopeptidase [Mycobacterium sp. NPDC051804]|uniref:M15 family metallopeptidase n=1 Tax=Mycobacterium sp. NPDC051804 TaxID=3364295 RepID=UPI003789514F